MVSSELEGKPTEEELNEPDDDGGGGTGGQGGEGGTPVVKDPIPCGAIECSGDDICCVPYGNPAGSLCAPSCPPDHTPIHCHDKPDCDPGAYCCGDFDLQANHYVQVVCKSRCSPGFEAITQFEMCGETMQCQSSQWTCEPSQGLPPQYAYCNPL
jgi:hypothetical protein